MKRGILMVVAAVTAGMLLLPGAVAAATPTPSPAAASASPKPAFQTKEVCLGLKITDSQDNKGCLKNSQGDGGAIVEYLRLLLKVLSGGIVIVIILMIVYAGFGYITSMGDPGAIKSAKDKIVNAITALVLFLMAFAILNFLIPGGVL